MSGTITATVNGVPYDIQWDGDSDPTPEDYRYIEYTIRSQTRPAPDRQPAKQGWVDRAVAMQRPAQTPAVTQKVPRTLDLISDALAPTGGGVHSQSGIAGQSAATGATQGGVVKPTPSGNIYPEKPQTMSQVAKGMTPQKLDALARQNPEAAKLIYDQQALERGNPFTPDFTNTGAPLGSQGFVGRDTGGVTPVDQYIQDLFGKLGRALPGVLGPSFLAPALMNSAIGDAGETLGRGIGRSVAGAVLAPINIGASLGQAASGERPLWDVVKELGSGFIQSLNILDPNIDATERISRFVNLLPIMLGLKLGRARMREILGEPLAAGRISKALSLDYNQVANAINRALTDDAFLAEARKRAIKNGIEVFHEGENLTPSSFREGSIQRGATFRTVPGTPEPVPAPIKGAKGKTPKAPKGTPEPAPVPEQVPTAQKPDVAATETVTPVETPSAPKAAETGVQAPGAPVAEAPATPKRKFGHIDNIVIRNGEFISGSEEARIEFNKAKAARATSGTGTPNRSLKPIDTATVEELLARSVGEPIEPKPTPSNFWESNKARLEELERARSGPKRNTRSGMAQRITKEDYEYAARRALHAVYETGTAISDAVASVAKELAIPADKIHKAAMSIAQEHPDVMEVISRVPKAPVPKVAAPAGTGIQPNNAGMDALRNEVGLPEVGGSSDLPHRNANAPYNPADIEAIIKAANDDVAAGVQPEAIPAHTSKHFEHYLNQLKSEYDNAKGPAASNAARKKLEDATRAFVEVGRPAGQQLAARVGTSAEAAGDYSPGGSVQHFVESVPEGTKLPDDYVAKTDELGKKWKAQKEVVEAKLAAENEAKAKQALAVEQAKAKRQANKASIDKERQIRAAAIARIKEKFSKTVTNNSIMSDPTGLQTGAKLAKGLAEIAPDIVEIAKSYVREGIVKIADIPNRIVKDFGGQVTLDDVHQSLAGAFDRPKKQVSAEAAAVAEKMKELREQANAAPASQKAKIERRIGVLQKRLEDLDFQTKPRPKFSKEVEGEYIRMKSLESQIDDIRKQTVYQAKKSVEGTPEHAMDLLNKVAGAYTNAVASTDVSWFANQGIYGLLTHPNKAFRALGAGLKAAISEGNMHAVEGWLRSRPHYNLMRASNLEIGEGAGIHDFFISGILEKPGTVNIKGMELGLNPIRASERAFAAEAKVMRALWFESMVKSYETPLLGKAFPKMKIFENRAIDLASAKNIAEAINTLTGVGTGEVGRTLRSLNTKAPVLFGPSLLVSRWKAATGTPLWNAVLRKDWRVARMVAGEYAKTAAGIVGSVYAMQKLGMDIETDPRSPNYLKVRLHGNFWIDPFNGLQRPLAMMYQIKNGYKDSSGNVNESGSRVMDILGSYIVNKVNPFSRAVVENIHGSTLYGDKPMNFTTKEGALNNVSHFLPMSVQNVWETIHSSDLSPTEKSILAALSIFGLNVQDRSKN